MAVKIARDAARPLKVVLLDRRVASVEELRAGLRALRAGEADAYCFVTDAMVISRVALVIDAARRKKLPTMFIEQRDRLYSVINLKTAKARRLTIPPSLLARADEVIE